MNINRKPDKCNVFEFASQNVQFILLWNCYFQTRQIALVTLKNVKCETFREKRQAQIMRHEIDFLMKK